MSTVPLYAVAGAALVLGLSASSAAMVLEAEARAAGAADAAALASADAMLGWVQAQPCELAQQLVAEVGARLDLCETDPARGQVRVSVGVQTIFGMVSARARAGPPVA